MMTLSHAVAIAALAAQAVPSSLPIAKAKGGWNVHRSADRCLASRSYDTAYGPMIVQLAPHLLGRSAVVNLTFHKGPTTDQYWGRFWLSWPGRVTAANPQEFYRVSKMADDLRLLEFSIPLAELPKTDIQDLTLNFSEHDGLRFRFAKWDTLKAALDGCTMELRKAINFPEADYQKVAVHAVGNLMNNVSASDYPFAAIQAGEEGDVKMLFWIDTKGQVSDCKVVGSSGSRALDSRSCLIVKRTRYTPARGHDGAPVMEPSYAVLNWRIPSN